MNRRNFLAGLLGVTATAALAPIAGYAVWGITTHTFVIHFTVVGATPEDQAKIDKSGLLTTRRVTVTV